MAALFSNENALLLRLLCRVLNEMHANPEKRVTRQDILDRIKAGFPGEGFLPTEAETSVIEVLFPKEAENANGKLTPFYDAPVPGILSADERLWLKTMLTDESVAFLLSENLRKKLLARLQEVPEFSLGKVWKKRQAKGDDSASEPMRSHLGIVWRALREEKKIHYVNIDKNGIRHEHTLSPCRLEYDAAANRYSVIVWDETDERAVKIRLRRLESLELSNDKILPDAEKKLRKFLREKKCDVYFRLLDKEGSTAVDRCFFLFSAFDKKSCAEKDGSFTVHVKFRAFDRHEVIRRILSLGSAVVVTRPEDIRQEIIDRLQKGWERCRDGSAVCS